MYSDEDWDDDFDFTLEEGGNVLRTISNGEESVRIVEKEDGVYSSDGDFICSLDDEELEDKVNEYAEGWRETHWNRSDWADYYGCDEDSLDDAMDDDIKDL